MSLIQISKLEPCANLGFVVGIDFGTTNSLVAHVNGSEIDIIPTEDNELMLPSVVLYNDANDVIVGKIAAKSDEAIFSIKRLMGGDKNKIYGKFSCFEWMDQDEKIYFNIYGKKISNIEIASEILKKLKYFAEKFLKESVSTAVITVPAYFNNKAKESIKIAAKLAGINAIRLLAEPTAAALAYKIKENGTYLVYDLGGGTFDVSIIDFNNGIFKVIAVGGDDMLGGDDCDYILVQKIISDLNLTINSNQFLKQLKMLARSLKEKFFDSDIAKISFIYNNTEYEYILKIDDFNNLVYPLIKSTIDITYNVISVANKKVEEIKKVLLVGGSTKMQIVKNKLCNVFNKEKILSSDNPETLVVKGAALQAHYLNFGSKTLIIDVTPLSLGIETFGGVMEKIIERNTSIPVSKSQFFTTHVDGQTSILINIYQGERELVKDNKELIRIELKNIPPMPAGVPKIKVIFTIDENALLIVSAHEITSNTKQDVIINPNYELNENEIKKMINDSFINAEKDLINRELLTTKIDFEKIIELVSRAIVEDRELLNDDEYKKIASILENIKEYNVYDIDHVTKIKKLKKEIETASESFLEKRFKKYIKKISLKK